MLLVRALMNIADAKSIAGRAEGVEEAKRAVALGEETVARNPAVVRFRRTLAASLMSLGQAHYVANKREDARSSYRRAVEVYEGTPEAQRSLKDELNLAATYSNLAEQDRLDEKFEGAAALNRKGLAIVEPLLEAHPNDVLIKATAANLEQNLGDGLSSLSPWALQDHPILIVMLRGHNE